MATNSTEETTIVVEETAESVQANSIEETTRHLATIAKIEEILPIPDSDNIELVRVRNWYVIVKKLDNFKVGDLVIYVEIDSILPTKPEFEFLKECKYRIKTRKMRGVYSQGIVFPLSILPEDIANTPVEDMNVTQILGIRKYDPPDEYGFFVNKNPSTFPSQIPKSDEERVQNCWGRSWKMYKTTHQDAKCYLTEKLDGMSITIFVIDENYGVCSRNHKVSEDTVWFQTAASLNMEAKLRSLNKNIAFQGELIGPKIQGNMYRVEAMKIYFYSAFDIDTQKYLDYSEFLQLIKQLELESVPIINSEFTIPEDYKELIDFSDNCKSVLNPESIIEGFVFVFPCAVKGRYSFKVISRNYEMRVEEKVQNAKKVRGIIQKNKRKKDRKTKNV